MLFIHSVNEPAMKPTKYLLNATLHILSQNVLTLPSLPDGPHYKLSHYNEQFDYNEVTLLIIPHPFTTIPLPSSTSIPCWHLTLKTQ